MEPARSERVALGLCAVGLLACMAGLWALAPHFTYGSPMKDRPIVWLSLLLMGAALPYLCAVFLVRRNAMDRRTLMGIVLAGLAMRAVVAPTQPMLEDDFYRYLWDGAMVSHGYNPFVHIPDQVLDHAENVPVGLATLGEEAGTILERVNHPHLATIYPAVAQAAFALAHQMRPWSLGAWKLVLFLCDAATLALLLFVLRQMGLPAGLCLVYWWNPLLVKETYNSGHMDVVILPWVMGALLFSLRRLPVRSMACLALAVCAKVWPLLLAPLLLWPHRRDPKRALLAVLTFVCLIATLFWPVYAAYDLGDDSGIVAYSEYWEMNDALYMAFPWTVERVLAPFDVDPTHNALHRISRVVIALLLGCLVIFLTLRHSKAESLGGAALAVVAALYLLSPTQYPWYYVWLLPLLAIRPTWSLLCLTLTLPLYYLKFHYDARGNVNFFHYRVVWVEHGPILALVVVELAWRWVRDRTRKGEA